MLLSSPPRRGCFLLKIKLGPYALVFPASAGVFRSKSTGVVKPPCLPRLGGGVSHSFGQSFHSKGLPRLGGGVSAERRRASQRGWSSPPRRGCFGALSSASYEVPSSPPRRGCFQEKQHLRKEKKVFPASAGVFPQHDQRRNPSRSLPRLGGGVSYVVMLLPEVLRSSPPRRGCFSDLMVDIPW